MNTKRRKKIKEEVERELTEYRSLSPNKEIDRGKRKRDSESQREGEFSLTTKQDDRWKRRVKREIEERKEKEEKRKKKREKTREKRRRTE